MIITLGTTPALGRTMTFATLTIDDVNRATAVYAFASGKSINVARVIQTLGRPVIATGFLGGDSGRFCQRNMAANAITHDFVSVGNDTRTCVTLVDQQHHTATELIEEAPAVLSADVDQLLAKLESLLPQATVLVLSGGLAPGVEEDFYRRCLHLANAKNVRVILDAKGKPLSLALSEHPYVIKPNRGELSATVNCPITSDQDLVDAIRAVVKRGARWVVVTDGPRATVVSDGQQFWAVQSPMISVVNPIGSGDAFAAGIAVGLSDEAEVPAACVLGAACGAANAMTQFAGHVRLENVNDLRGSISLVPFIY